MAQFWSKAMGSAWPWGRPDMAMFLFVNAIRKGETIKVFNEGNLERDFTFIDDIINGILAVIDKATFEGEAKFRLYNIGKSEPVKLLSFIEEIENQLGVIAKKKLMPMQPGDVEKTWADSKPIMEDYDYQPKVEVKEGVKKYLCWYQSYYG